MAARFDSGHSSLALMRREAIPEAPRCRPTSTIYDCVEAGESSCSDFARELVEGSPASTQLQGL